MPTKHRSTGAQERRRVNPQDFLSAGVSQRAEQTQERQAKRDSKGAVGKTRTSVLLADDVLDHAKAALYWVEKTTLSGLIEAALRRELARLESERGEPFPRRSR
jgi:hypothetical protein